MSKKLIHFTPDQLGYKDRGKMKWLGLMLSDHSESLHQMGVKEKEDDVAAKPQQSLAEIGEVLSEAYHLKKPIAIQANILQNGSYFHDVPCLVSGIYEEKIFLVLKDGKIIDTTLEDIRNVSFLDSDVWHQKSKK